MTDEEKTFETARLNDLARKDPDAANALVVAAPGLKALLSGGEVAVGTVMQKLTAFDDFVEGNDPYNERDMGEFKIGRHTIIWKVDYYDLDMGAHSEAEWDVSATKRVITLMLPEDY